MGPALAPLSRIERAAQPVRCALPSKRSGAPRAPVVELQSAPPLSPALDRLSHGVNRSGSRATQFLGSNLRSPMHRTVASNGTPSLRPRWFTLRNPYRPTVARNVTRRALVASACGVPHKQLRSSLNPSYRVRAELVQPCPMTGRPVNRCDLIVINERVFGTAHEEEEEYARAMPSTKRRTAFRLRELLRASFGLGSCRGRRGPSCRLAELASSDTHKGRSCQLVGSRRNPLPTRADARHVGTGTGAKRVSTVSERPGVA